MTDIIQGVVDWINSTFNANLEVSLYAGTPEYYLALGVGLAFFAFMGLFFAGTLGNRPRLSIVIGAVLTALACGILVEHWTGLLDWLALGFEFKEIGPTLFAVGMTCFTAVIGWNALRTKGDKLVL